MPDAQGGPSNIRLNLKHRRDDRVYPTRDTMDWDRCPVYRRLNKDGWVPRGQPWTPNLLLGIAIGDGLSHHYKAGIEAELVTETRIREGYVENPEWTIAGLVKLGLRGLRAAIDADVTRGGIVLRVDESVGVGRPDLVFRTQGAGLLAVSDTKVSLFVDSRYRASRLAEYETDHQMWHYIWEVGEHYGEMVSLCRVLQVILTPKTVATCYDIENITSERIQFWLRGAERLWDGMAREDPPLECAPSPRFSSCNGKYGQCIYMDWCHLFGGNAEKAEAYYERRER